MDCGFDSACLGAITVIAHIVRRPDNRFHYLEVSGVPSSEPVAAGHAFFDYGVRSPLRWILSNARRSCLDGFKLLCRERSGSSNSLPVMLK